MLSRAVCRVGAAARALSKRQASGIARRSVTTDAASSHAEKGDVPEVSLSDCDLHVDWQQDEPY